MSSNCPVARAELVGRGYVVHEVDVSEFLKAGGGANCLVLTLGRLRKVLEVPSDRDAVSRVTCTVDVR